MTVIRMFENSPENNKTNIKNKSLILAHGAGASADSGFMEHLSAALASEGVSTVRFEFPYMARRREDGRKRPPDRQPRLLEHFREVILQVYREQGGPVFIGGKSMGGRMASLLAADPEMAKLVRACLCFGYPFHPPGKPDRWRVAHFDRFCVPAMIIQGTRDPFGGREEVGNCTQVSESDCRLHWLEGGNHDFVPLKRQPETQNILIEQAAEVAAVFMTECG